MQESAQNLRSTNELRQLRLQREKLDNEYDDCLQNLRESLSSQISIIQMEK